MSSTPSRSAADVADLDFVIVAGADADELRQLLLAAGAAAARIRVVEPRSGSPEAAPDVVVWPVDPSIRSLESLSGAWPAAAQIAVRNPDASPPAAPLHDDFDASGAEDLLRAVGRARRLAAAEAAAARPQPESPLIAAEWSDSGVLLLDTLLAATPAGICVKDLDGRFVLANPSAAHFLGKADVAEILGRTGAEFLEPAVARLCGERERQALDSDVPLTWEEALLPLEGPRRELVVQRGRVQDRAGRVIGVYVMLRDVTALKEIEASRARDQHELTERVKELNALYRVMQTLARDDLSLDDRLLYAAEQVPAGWQYPDVAECRIVVGENGYETHLYRETAWRLSAELPADSGLIGSVTVCYGEERPAADVGPFLHEEQALLEAVARHVADAVRRDQLESSLRQSQKMQAVGRLAGGVAHDFNNLLTGIGGIAHLLLLDTPEDDPRHRDLREILSSTDRAAQLTRQLLAFSRREVVRPTDVDVHDLLRGFAPMLERMAGSRVKVRLDLEEAALVTHIDETQLEQVLLNLVANARDALPEGGDIVIRTRRAELDGDAAARISPSLPAGGYVCIEVEDSGHGIDEATRPHVFEPFFTTRKASGASGLGLSTVYGIVTDAGGAVSVESQPDDGATFRIRLPLVGSKPEQQQDAAGHDHNGGTGGAIFVVDDDATVRQLVARILRRAGESVRVFEDAERALAALDDADARVSVLVTDVVMPGMNGLQLAERAAQTRPGLPVLLMSGYVEESERAAAGELPFIAKPFSPDVFLERVREMLPAESSRGSHT